MDTYRDYLARCEFCGHEPMSEKEWQETTSLYEQNVPSLWAKVATQSAQGIPPVSTAEFAEIRSLETMLCL